MLVNGACPFQARALKECISGCVETQQCLGLYLCGWGPLIDTMSLECCPDDQP